MAEIGHFIGFLRAILRLKAEKREVTLCKVFGKKSDSLEGRPEAVRSGALHLRRRKRERERERRRRRSGLSGLRNEAFSLYEDEDENGNGNGNEDEDENGNGNGNGNEDEDENENGNEAEQSSYEDFSVFCDFCETSTN